ncbi:MAG: hypothetical protein RSF83_00185 [Hungatella sp.]
MNESVKSLPELLLKDETVAKKVLAAIAEKRESGELADAKPDGIVGGSGYTESTLGSSESDALREAKQQFANAGRAKAEADATANELAEEKLVSVSGGANSFVGIPVGQIITGPIQEAEKDQAALQKSFENFLKTTSS